VVNVTKRLSLLEIINNYLDSDQMRLPPFDATSKRIQGEAMKETPDTDLIERLVIRDQALTGQVLRIANSAFYKGLVKVSTVRNAILRLGVNEVSNIVTLVSQQESYKSKDPKINTVLRELWKHSLGCAIGAHWIAKNTGFANLASESFFAGLLHDVGKLFIMAVLEQLKQSQEIDVQPAPALLHEIMANQHSQYGFDLMKNWNLPEHYCHIARDHHAETIDPKNYLLLIVRVADKACNKAGIGCEPDASIALSGLPETKVLNLTEVDLAKLEIHLEDANLLG